MERLFSNPRFLRTLENKLEKEQRKLSRRYEQAKKDKKPLHEARNYQKQRVKVALIHEKIKNVRTDYLHKVSTEIVKNFPSSQLCSNCGFKYKIVKNLALRKWQCPSCHIRHDRDRNASINIEVEAIRLLTVGAPGIA